MQIQKLSRRKLKLHHFEVILDSLPDAPILYDLDSHWVDRSGGRVNLTINLTEGMRIIAIYEQERLIHRPAPALTMGQFIQGDTNLSFLRNGSISE